MERFLLRFTFRPGSDPAPIKARLEKVATDVPYQVYPSKRKMIKNKQAFNADVVDVVSSLPRVLGDAQGAEEIAAKLKDFVCDFIEATSMGGAR